MGLDGQNYYFYDLTKKKKFLDRYRISRKIEINFINYRMDNKKYVSLINNQLNKYADCEPELYFSTR